MLLDSGVKCSLHWPCACMPQWLGPIGDHALCRPVHTAGRAAPLLGSSQETRCGKVSSPCALCFLPMFPLAEVLCQYTYCTDGFPPEFADSAGQRFLTAGVTCPNAQALLKISIHVRFKVQFHEGEFQFHSGNKESSKRQHEPILS